MTCISSYTTPPVLGLASKLELCLPPFSSILETLLHRQVRRHCRSPFPEERIPLCNDLSTLLLSPSLRLHWLPSNRAATILFITCLSTRLSQLLLSLEQRPAPPILEPRGQNDPPSSKRRRSPHQEAATTLRLSPAQTHLHHSLICHHDFSHQSWRSAQRVS